MFVAFASAVVRTLVNFGSRHAKHVEWDFDQFHVLVVHGFDATMQILASQ